MPILQVFAAPSDDAIRRLEQMCDAVAYALDLTSADVVATHITVDQTVIDGVGNRSWPVVVIHGSSRPATQMNAAAAAVAALARTWAGRDHDGTWVTWQERR